MIDPAEIDNRFTYHAPSPETVVVFETIREQSRDLAHYLNAHVGGPRELALALTKLEEVVMHANSGIARHGLEEVE